MAASSKQRKAIEAELKRKRRWYYISFANSQGHLGSAIVSRPFKTFQNLSQNSRQNSAAANSASTRATAQVLVTSCVHGARLAGHAADSGRPARSRSEERPGG